MCQEIRSGRWRPIANSLVDWPEIGVYGVEQAARADELATVVGISVDLVSRSRAL